MASRDLRKLGEAGLPEPLGEKRGRSYRLPTAYRDTLQQVHLRWVVAKSGISL